MGVHFADTMAMKLVAASVLSLLLVGCLLVVLSPTEVQTGSSIQDPTTALAANGRTAIEEFEDIPEPVTAPLPKGPPPDCTCDEFIAGAHQIRKGECLGNGATSCTPHPKKDHTWWLAHPESVRPTICPALKNSDMSYCKKKFPDLPSAGNFTCSLNSNGAKVCQCTFGWGGLNCETELLITPQKGFEDPMPTCGFGIAFTGFTDFLPGTLFKSVNGTKTGTKTDANGIRVVTQTSGPFVNFIHEGSDQNIGQSGVDYGIDLGYDLLVRDLPGHSGEMGGGPGLQSLRMYQYPDSRTSMAYGAPFAGDTAWEYWLTLGLPFGSEEDKAKAAGKWCIWTPGQELITDPRANDWGLVQPVDIPDATNKITLFATCDNCPGHKGWLNSGFRKSEATWTSAIDPTHQVKNIATCCEKDNGGPDWDFCPKQHSFLSCEFHGCNFGTGGCYADSSDGPKFNCKAPY